MTGKPQNLATAEIGKQLGYEHFQVHSLDIPAFDKLGRHIRPQPDVPMFSIELWTIGSEGDIMHWFLNNWNHSIGYSIIYVMLIFIGQRFMKNRERFDLRTPLILWSGLLAVFSILGSLRGISDMIYLLSEHGFYHTVCHPSCFYGVPGSWALYFVLSKVVELGDTAFIVLRKQPLIFLHWYHHVTVLCYSWLTYAHHAAPGRWFTIMNFVVHAFMYSYYTARAMRFRVPRPIMMGITILQLSQMVIGLLVTIYAYNMHTQGIFCHFPSDNMYWAFVMYLSYFILFLNYFYHAYLKPKGRSGVTNGAVPTKAMNGNISVNGTCLPAAKIHQNGDTHHSNGHTKKEV